MTTPYPKLFRAFPMLALVATAVACGGANPPAGLGDEAAELDWLDGPADHVGGRAVPQFTVWVLDRFDRRATGIPGGTLALDLLGPDGSVQQAGFASIPVSFGQAVVSPSTVLPQGEGYALRGRFQNLTQDSPRFRVVAEADVIDMSNASTGEAGMIIDGENNIGRLADLSLRTTASEVEAGVFDSRGAAQAVTIFAPDRRPELLPVTWTPNADRVEITLQDRVAIPLTVWVIGGDFAAEQARVQSAIDALNEAWRTERAGVEVTDVRFMDATSQANPFELFAIGIGAPFGPLQDNIGREGGRYNLYVVTTIRFNQMDVNGFAEQGGTALAVTTSGLQTGPAQVIGHELGHNWGLVDVGTAEGFVGQGNMMGTGSATPLTEGQIFRAHFGQFSSLRQFRSGDTFGSLSCPPFDATTDCPALDFRVWEESEGAAALTPRN